METLGNQQLLTESVKKYVCKKCDYITNVKQHYEKHIYTSKHNNSKNGNQKLLTESVKKYVCKKCDYITNIKQNYDKHILSRKHNLETLGNQSIIKSENTIFQCEKCNKEYLNRSGLWKHRQKCNNINNESINNESINNHYDEKITINNDNTMNIILELVKQNSEFKELIAEQNKYIVSQNQNLQNHFIELSKEKVTMNNCNNTNNITNNNNHFNLNLFLNETCKNAMNINEFVEQINVTINDLEDTARLGYAEGISRIFIKGLKQLEVNERPIHCSDAKRETVYIKEGDIWEKDDSDKSRLTNAIRKVGHKNIRMIPEWKKKYPDCEDYYSNKNDLYLKIVNQSMCGGSIEETETNYNKIRKNIIKQVIIEK
jgi:hypothetical protein